MRIDDVELTTPDPAGTAAAYGELLGLPVELGPDGPPRVRCGASTVTFVAGENGPGSHHLAFAVPDAGFDAAREWVRARVPLMGVQGSEVFHGRGHWDSRSVYFAGPDRSVLELIARRPLPDADLLAAAGAGSLADLPPSAVAAVSEVGVAVPDLPALIERLAGAGLAGFGTPAPDFAPVGDHDGLLILTSPGRPWWPQHDLVSGGGPTRVRLRTAGGPVRVAVSRDQHVEIDPPG